MRAREIFPRLVAVYRHASRSAPTPTAPATRSEFREWIRAELGLPAAKERELIDRLDAVFVRHERLWEQSKQDAIRAVSAGWVERVNRLRDELSERDTTVSSISQYFEELVADLTDQVHRDPKTRLLNFRRFLERLEAFLALDQRGRWCAVGLIDITSFKWYNDTFGHAVGDLIIERVAHLVRTHLRAEDVLVETPDTDGNQDLHARFGGDEFCFLIPDLQHSTAAASIAQRFRDAVGRHDWSADDHRLAERPVSVDVGVVCLLLGPVSERRSIAHQLGQQLIARADRLMYTAKFERATHVHHLCLRIEGGRLVEHAAEADAQPVSSPTRSS